MDGWVFCYKNFKFFPFFFCTVACKLNTYLVSDRFLVSVEVELSVRGECIKVNLKGNCFKTFKGLKFEPQQNHISKQIRLPTAYYIKCKKKVFTEM